MGKYLYKVITTAVILAIFLVMDRGMTAVSQGQHRAYLPIIANREPRSGLAWHNRRPAEASILHGVDWYYSYALRPYASERAEFVPMLWCDRWPALAYANGYDYLAEARKRYAPDYDGYFLILNEPDLPGSDRDGGQCGMSPRQAAYFYRAALSLWPGARFVGPAVSHRDYLAGFVWLREFARTVESLGLPLPEIAAIHTYLDEPPHLIVDATLELLANFETGATAVWVTEFGSCNPAATRKMLAGFAGDARVKRYAYFTTVAPGCTDLFYDQPGYTLTENGRAWRDFHK